MQHILTEFGTASGMLTAEYHEATWLGKRIVTVTSDGHSFSVNHIHHSTSLGRISTGRKYVIDIAPTAHQQYFALLNQLLTVLSSSMMLDEALTNAGFTEIK